MKIEEIIKKIDENIALDEELHSFPPQIIQSSGSTSFDANQHVRFVLPKF